MKKGLLLLMMMVVGLVAKPCSCEDKFFCESFDPDSSIVVYGYKLTDINAIGVSFKVIDSWGAVVHDTIYVWNDSAYLYESLPNPWVCYNDIRTWFYVADTVLLNVKRNYTGSGYGAAQDYLFQHGPCGKYLLNVVSGTVNETKSGFSSGPVTYIIEETLAEYKNRLLNAQGCAYTRISTSIDNGPLSTDFSVFFSNGQLSISGLNQTGPTKLNLYNITGQLVYTSTSTDTQYDLSNLSPALYIAEICYQDEIYRQKVLLQ